MSRKTFRLVLDVTYETNEPDAEAEAGTARILHDNLLDLPRRLMTRRWLTKHTDAYIVVIAPSVQEL
jgi:hypothetical protein